MWNQVAPFEWLVIVLASYRMTRLIVLDSLLGTYPDEDIDGRRQSEGTRWRRVLDQWAYDELGQNRGPLRGFFGDLLTCTWCAGVWITTLACIGWVYLPEYHAPWYVAAAAGVQGYLNARPSA